MSERLAVLRPAAGSTAAEEAAGTMATPDLPLAAFNALSSQIAILDSRGAIVLVNAAWIAFAAANGGPSDAAAHVGLSYLDVCERAARDGDEAAGRVKADLERLLAGEAAPLSRVYPCHAPDRERWFRMSVRPFETRGHRYLVVAHENITEQWTSRRALEASERLLRLVLESLPVGVWILDATGRIVLGNAAGVRIWAGSRFVASEQFGQYRGWWRDTGEPIAADEWAAARAIHRGETSIDEEIEIECFDTTHKIILNSAVPLRDEAGRVSGAIVVNQDITARVRAEGERQALLRSQGRRQRTVLEANRRTALEESRVKDEFIATLSHELRTPLQAILGWSAVLRRTLPESHEGRRAADAIERNARLQVQLLNDTLDISRIVRGDFPLDRADVDLAVLAADVVETMRPIAAERRIALTIDPGPTPAIVAGDTTRLQQAAWNLLNNALKFTRPGGRVDVAVRAESDWVELSVRDNGVGIAPEFMPFLFDRFRQGGPVARTRLGLGLGLAIVKEIVERHRGVVTAESEGVDRGATFIVRLPTARVSSRRH